MESFAPLFSNFKGIFILILFFGGSIFIHELGHYLAAKWRKLKIERFSIGFGPRLFGWTNKDGVDFRISLLPLGGYVALPQLADMGRMEGATEETEEDAETEKLPPISFSDKFYVAVAGAVFNVLFALAMGLLLWKIGQPTSEGQETTTIGYVAPTMELDDEEKVPGPAHEAGLLPGDTILAIDGQDVGNFMEVQHGIVTGAGRDKNGNPKTTFKVKRNGDILEFDVFPKLITINTASGDRIRQIGIMPASHIVTTLFEGTPAVKAGLQLDDRIISINGKPTYSTLTLRDEMEKNGFEPIRLGIERNGKPMELQIEPMHAAERKTTIAISLSVEGTPITLHFLPKYEEPQKELPAPDAPSTWLLYEMEGKLPDAHSFQPKIGDSLQQIASTNINNLEILKKSFEESADSETRILTLKSDSTLRNLKLPAEAELKIIPTPIRPILGLGTGGETLIHLDPITQVKQHIRTTLQVLSSLLNKNSDIGVQQLSGPIGIGRVFHKYANIDLRLVLVFAVLLNINLAILNLLPIPVLDGGHILFATIAKFRKNGLPINLIVRIQTAFVLLLFSMIIYVGVYDSLRWKGDNDEEHRIKVLRELYFRETIFTAPQEIPEATPAETEAK